MALSTKKNNTKQIESHDIHRPQLHFHMNTQEENKRKMDEEGNIKSREPPLGYPMPPVQLPHPQTSPADFAVPPPPPYVPGTHPSGAQCYAQEYQNYPGEGASAAQIAPSKIDRLPCWGIGLGWFLFIIGFFLAAIPWYVGALILIFVGVDYREKQGYVACTIAAAISAVSAFFYLIRTASGW